MKKNILLFFAIFLSVILEISFLPKFFGQKFSPSLALILVIIISKEQGWGRTWIWAVVAGIILDILSFGIIGMHAFSFLAVSLLVGFISERFLTSQRSWNFFVIVLLIFMSSFLNDLILAVFLKLEFLFSRKMYLEGDIFLIGKTFYRAIFSAILGIVLYGPIKKFQSGIFRKSQAI